LFQLVPLFVVCLSAVFSWRDSRLSEVSRNIIDYCCVNFGFLQEVREQSVFRRVEIHDTLCGADSHLHYLGQNALGLSGFLVCVFWNILGTFCGVFILMSFSKPRKEFRVAVSEAGKKAVFTAFIGEGLYIMGTICSLAALSLVDASLASALFGLQPFFVFFYILLMSLFLPKILNEDISKSIVMLKASAIALMLIGTWLVI